MAASSSYSVSRHYLCAKLIDSNIVVDISVMRIAGSCNGRRQLQRVPDQPTLDRSQGRSGTGSAGVARVPTDLTRRSQIWLVVYKGEIGQSESSRSQDPKESRKLDCSVEWRRAPMYARRPQENQTTMRVTTMGVGSTGLLSLLACYWLLLLCVRSGVFY